MVLARIGVLLIVGFIVLVEAVIISIMKDSAKGNKKLFHKWLIIWATVHTVIIVAGYFLATGTILGFKP